MGFNVYRYNTLVSKWPNLALCCSFTVVILFGFSRQPILMIFADPLLLLKVGSEYFFSVIDVQFVLIYATMYS